MFTLDAPALVPTPGFLYNYVAGESPDGDNDAALENTAGAKDFKFAFNNGPQTPVNVSDSTTSRISRAYAFPAAHASVATTPEGFTRSFSQQDVSFELWSRQGALAGRRLLFEIGGARRGTSLILDNHVLHFTTIDLLGQSGAASCTLSLNGGTVTASDSISAGYQVYAGINGTGLGRVNSRYAGHTDLGGASGFFGEIAVLRIYDRALTAEEIAHNHLLLAAPLPEITQFAITPTNAAGTTGNSRSRPNSCRSLLGF